MKGCGHMTLGERIQRFRKSSGLTQKQLAEKIEKTYSSVQKYELGIAEPPISVLQKIAEALGVSTLELLGPIDPEDPADQKTFGQYIKGGKAELPGLMDGASADEEIRAAALASAFKNLNEKGQETAVERVEELTKIPDYQKKKEP